MKYPENKARILVVEDEPTIRHLLSLFLRKDYDVEVAASVEEALKAAAEHPFDVFLLDINLREERSGFDLLQALREMPNYQDTPAIACTAYATYNNMDSYQEGGFNGCVSKPFTRTSLFNTLAEVLSTSSLSQDIPVMRKHNLAA